MDAGCKMTLAKVVEDSYYTRIYINYIIKTSEFLVYFNARHFITSAQDWSTSIKMAVELNSETARITGSTDKKQQA
jgi:hypothetical protein